MKIFIDIDLLLFEVCELLGWLDMIKIYEVFIVMFIE